jgi:ribosome biogenesis GTPase
LEDLGWGPFVQQQLNSAHTGEFVPARVVEEMKGAYRAYAEFGSLSATMSGRLRHEALTRDALPSVGDWVLIATRPGNDGAIIHRVLERHMKLSRKTAGERTEEQILAANIETVFLVIALNRDFNPRRIERYLAVIWQSGAEPVVLLNKADLCAAPDACVRQAKSIAPGVAVHATSTLTNSGAQAVRRHLAQSETAVFVGSSGAGKSSLINGLLNDAAQSVRGIRADGRAGIRRPRAR